MKFSIAISTIFVSLVTSQAIVTVIHPHPVTVVYDQSSGQIIPFVPSNGTAASLAAPHSHRNHEHLPSNIDNTENEIGQEGGVDTTSSAELEVDQESGQVNAMGTVTYQRTSITGSESTTSDSNTAFRLNLPLSLGSAAVIAFIAIIF